MLVSVSNLVGESWAYYLVIGVLEIGLAGLVVAYSYRWRGGARRRRRAGRPSRARAEEVALAMDHHAPPNQAV
jgi:hypothetical protein